MDLKLFSHVTSEVILWSCTVGVMVSLFSNRGGLAREHLKISEETRGWGLKPEMSLSHSPGG